MSKTSEIADEILKRIRTNYYTEKVPGERFLADEFDVNVKTANRAVSQLVEQGVLFRKRGEGTFIAPLNKRSDLSIGLCFYKYTHPGRDPVFTRFFSGVNAAARNQGVRLDVTALQDIIDDDRMSKKAQQERFKDIVLSSNPDGLLFLGNINAKMIKMLNDDRPTIVVGQSSPKSGFDTVRRDLRTAVTDAVKFFVDKGHKKIAFATPRQGTEDHDVNEKKQGYLQGMADAGLEVDVIAGTEDLIATIKKHKPTAVIAAESTYGILIMREAPAAGFSIPDDLAVISFDDGDVGNFTQPSMSSIHAFGEELAELAVEKLLDKLDGHLNEQIDVTLPCPFIERDSSG